LALKQTLKQNVELIVSLGTKIQKLLGKKENIFLYKDILYKDHEDPYVIQS
jgi:hypothetical protein